MTDIIYQLESVVNGRLLG